MINVNLLYDAKSIGYLRRGLVTVSGISGVQARRKRKMRLWGAVAVLSWIVAMMILLVPVAPYVLYGLFPEATAAIADGLSETADVEKSAFGEVVYEEPIYVPPFDANLPRENRLVIEKIGFDSEIGEAPVEEVESVLKIGPWRAPNMGTPVFRNAPMVIAAHRFGYLAWTNQYRRENSFFNLPKLENGDRIEVIWEQRKYVYEIYEGYTDTELHSESYDGDLILYTCEMLNSNRRVVRVARFVFDESELEVLSPFGKLVTLGTK